MAKKHQLDTNVCLYFLNGTLPTNGFKLVARLIDNEKVVVSVITQIELLGFNFPSTEAQIITEDFLNSIPIIPLSEEIINETIRIRRDHNTKLPDAVIGATASVLNIPLLTRNTKDFAAIDKLAVIDPFNI